jgi:hypothetical protein
MHLLVRQSELCSLLVQKSEKPAMIAVINPLSGDTPEAIPKAIDKGNATYPTIKPACKSLKKCCFFV